MTAQTARPRTLTINGRFLLQDVTGVQRVAIELVRAIDDQLADGVLRGWEVTVLLPRRGTLVTEIPFRAIRVRRCGRLSSHAWEQFELPVFAGSGPMLCLGNVAPVASLLGRAVSVHTMVHDLSFVYFPGAYSRAFRMWYSMVTPVVLSRSRRVFTVSNSERMAILSRYDTMDQDRLVAVQNGGGEASQRASTGSIAPNPGSSTDPVPGYEVRRRHCLYVGSLTGRKNVSGLMRAAVELVQSTDLDFVVVGATGRSFEEVRTQVPAGVAHRIHFRGQINDPEQIAQEYRKASVFVFPSFYEASPLPPVEAMREGCPVVAADIPSLRERCGEAAAYCDPHDVASIVTQVRSVVDDRAHWHRLQVAGLEQARRYSWRVQASTVMSHLAEAT